MGSDGWKNLDEVWIPPIEEEGFREEILIRKPIAPVLANTAAQAKSLPEPVPQPEVSSEPIPQPKEPEVSSEPLPQPAAQAESVQTEAQPEELKPLPQPKEPEPYKGEDATVLLADFEDYDGEDATVLLTQDAAFTAWVKRINTGEKVEIDKEMFVIGKSSSADYVIRDNMTVSRKHAAIKKTQDGYYLEDLGSSNHTFIDGVMVTEPVKLINGTMFQLSKEMFEFTIG